MPKLIVLSGLPGAGKTVKAFEIMEKHPGFERLSKKDRIEKLLTRPVVERDRIAKMAIKAFLHDLCNKMKSGCDIVVDDINLDPRHKIFYEKVAKDYHYEFEFIFVYNTIANCVKNSETKRSSFPQFDAATKDQILALARKYNLCKEELMIDDEEKEFVVYGLDDCIVDPSERRHLMTPGSSSNNLSPGYIWMDEPRESVVQMLNTDIENGYNVVIVTNRHERLRKATEDWLQSHYIEYNHLIMRGEFCTFQEGFFKFSAIQKRFDIKLCKKIVDDDPNVISIFEVNGIYGVCCDNEEEVKRINEISQRTTLAI